MPQVAIAHEGSCASTSRKAFSVSPYRNECSMATDRWKDSCTAGLHEFGKSTVPMSKTEFGLTSVRPFDPELKSDAVRTLEKVPTNRPFTNTLTVTEGVAPVPRSL